MTNNETTKCKTCKETFTYDEAFDLCDWFCSHQCEDDYWGTKEVRLDV